MINNQLIQMIMQMLQKQQGSNLFGQNPLSQQTSGWGPQGRPQGAGWNRFWPTQRPQSNYPAPQQQQTQTQNMAQQQDMNGMELNNLIQRYLSRGR